MEIFPFFSHSLTQLQRRRILAIFSAYNGSDNTALTNAILAPSSGIVVTSGTVLLNASAPDAVNFYDGTLAPLGIGAGLLLTSGTTPGTANTVGWFGQDNSGNSGFFNGDANIDAVVNTVFQTQSYDATTLSFDFTVTDPAAVSVSFDLVFGSDEFPEWVDQFVDSAIVMVNGVNYALFNHDPNHPLSVVSSNLAAGYFQDNAGNVLPIEYDGVSHVLKIVAPIIPGATNHITIGIADTGDHIYDSGIFLANLSAGTIPGSGVVVTPPSSGTDNSDNLTGSSKDEYFDLKGGDDTCYSGAGDDIVVAGAGNDAVFGGSGADQIKGDAGDDNLDGGTDADTAVFSGASSSYSITAVANGFAVTDSNVGPTSEGTDTLTSVEFVQFSDGLFAIGVGGVLTPVANPATPPANSPGSVVISGIGAVGNILTATVSDPNGISGAISYQWQVSSDGGVTWSNVGIDSNEYTVMATDVGQDIQVMTSYIDNGSQSEEPVSTPKTIQEVGDGDLVVTLIQLDAPAGASVINPLTTLVQDAIVFGLSPNMAELTVKTVLGLPAGVNLLTYDAYAALQINPTDPIALAVEKIAVEVAILTSLSDDDTGTNLTLQILDAGANNQTLNLAEANDLVNILGIVPPPNFDINDKNTFPEPMREIFDRHENIAQAANVGDIEAEWQDFLSIQDGVNSTSIADLSIHVNQAPTGVATASLADGSADTDYIVEASVLLQGFSDTENNPLNVSGLSADNGTVTDNGDGTFTITPNASYSGPVELTYSVVDGQGGSAPASQLFVMAPGAPANDAPTGVATAVLAAGTEDVAYTVNASDLLAGFSDGDGDTLSVAGLSASNGTVSDNGDGTFTITPTPNFTGLVTLSYNVTDGLASVAATQNYSLAPANDAPTGVATAVLAAGTEDVAYTVSASDLLAGFSDGDGDTLSVAGLSASNGTVSDNGDGTFTITPTPNFTGLVTLSYNVTDGLASVAAMQNYSLAPANDAPTANPDTASAGENEAKSFDVLANDTDPDLSDGKLLTSIDAVTVLSSNALVNGISAVSAMSIIGDQIRLVPGTLFDPLNAGESATVIVSYTMHDSTGAASSSALTLTINGAAEGPVYNVVNGTSGNDRNLNGTSSADRINGMAGNDKIEAKGGNDLIIAGAGQDWVSAGSGNDTIVGIINDGNDIYFGESGLDTFDFSQSDAAATVSLGLAAFGLKLNGFGYATSSQIGTDVLYEFENVIGGAGNDRIAGDDRANILNGGGGDDILNGGAGGDTINGGLGIDLLTGGTNKDTFVFNKPAASSGMDSITDFVSGTDKIGLVATDFGLAVGSVAAGDYVLGTTATAAHQQFIYDAASKTLLWDSDGTGAAATVALTNFTSAGSLTLQLNDLILV